MVADDESQNAGQQDGANDVADRPAHEYRQTEIHAQRERQVMSMLKCHQRVALQFAHVPKIRIAAGVITQHPADMGKPESATCAVRIAFSVIDEPMMYAMTGTPDQCAILQSHCAEQQKDRLER